MVKTKRATPVDAHVGRQLKHLRRTLEMSQTQIGDLLGVSFQQIQKYENGANCMSASALWMVAQALGVPVSFFYEGLDGGSADRTAKDNPLLDATERQLQVLKVLQWMERDNLALYRHLADFILAMKPEED